MMMNRLLSASSDSYGSECQTPSPEELNETSEYNASGYATASQLVQEWQGLVTNINIPINRKVFSI